MTTFGCIISIIGAAALSIQLTRLVAWMDRPRRRRNYYDLPKEDALILTKYYTEEAAQ